MNEIDLEKGDPEYEGSSPQELTPAQRRRQERRKGGDSSGGSGSGGSSGGSSGSRSRSSGNLVERLDKAFNKIAEQILTRGDIELADAIATDSRAMSQGIASLSGTFSILRHPILWFLGLLEPVLAFWHVGGILFGRWLDRRERRMAERQAVEAEMSTTGGEVAGT